MIRVRIAPSPTGFAHVGTAYAALFNYAFAKKNKGKFIIRIEDTDVKRNIKGAEKAIFDGLTWLGLSWDESTDVGGSYGPYRQSDRLEIYQKKIEKLIKNGFAYKDEGAVRFKNPEENVGWKDLIRGEISFPGNQITDFVIQKSDGYPTYNFAVVVDDILMKITHVIRGEEHISNTPRQLALYKAFGVKPPKFAHHPTLRNKEKKKLSKRRDPVDLRIYQKEGYLPEALLNFLALLGWSHPEEKEIFSLEEFVRLFDLGRVRKAGPIFNKDKLDWMDGEYIRQLSVDQLSSKVKVKSPRLLKGVDDKYLRKIVPLVQDRIKTLEEFESLAGFFFEKMKPRRELLGDSYQAHLTHASAVLQKVDNWTKTKIDKALMGTVKENDFNTSKFFMDFRIAITGSKVTPPINDSIAILGKKETLKRLEKILKE